jgi:hypothetical protein
MAVILNESNQQPRGRAQTSGLAGYKTLNTNKDGIINLTKGSTLYISRNDFL